jgi:hypothetical protein
VECSTVRLTPEGRYERGETFPLSQLG